MYAALVLTRAEIRNFRALESVNLELGPLTALIGPNGSGKSSALRAIDIALGSTWPSLRSFLVPQDFTGGDTAREISVEVYFDPPYQHKDRLGKTHDVPRMCVRCAPYKRRTRKSQAGDLHVDVQPFAHSGEPPSVAVEFGKDKQPIFRPLTASADLRAHNEVLFIDHRRSLAQHQPWARNSLLARLLAPVRRELPKAEYEPGKTHAEVFRERYELAVEALRTPALVDIEKIISETAKRTLGFLGSEATEGLDVGFGFADPQNPLGSLRLMYREGGIEIPTETLGLGTQSALVVGIFEAFRQQSAEIGTVLIEEPEMFLHPQAQRYFYRLLIDLVEQQNCQVIYSTHSPVFADVTRFASIRLIRRKPGGMAAVSAVTDATDRQYLEERRAGQKLLGLAGSQSELFFANRVLLVEGPSDELASRRVAKRLGHDLDAEDISIVGCGGKSGIPFMAKLCGALAIPFWVMHDQDLYLVPDDAERAAKVREANTQAEKLNKEITAATPEGRLFVLEPSLEEALGIGRSASDKPRRVAEVLAEADITALPESLVSAVQGLVAKADAATQ